MVEMFLLMIISLIQLKAMNLIQLRVTNLLWSTILLMMLHAGCV